MYAIAPVESMDTLRAFRQMDEVTATMPPDDLWLVRDQISRIAMGPQGPVGALLLSPCRHLGDLVTKYRLSWLYVLPEHRLLGVGRSLVKAAATEACRKGAATIQIPLKPENQSCIAWSAALPKVPGVGFVVSLDRCGGL